EKIAVISSMVWLIGWTRPRALGAACKGRVMSTVSALRRASSAAALRVALLASIRPAISTLRPLIAGPALLRSSAVMEPSEASNAETLPFLPKAATRTASSAASSPAAAMAADRSVRRVAIWLSRDMAELVRTDYGRLDLNKTPRASPYRVAQGAYSASAALGSVRR